MTNDPVQALPQPVKTSRKTSIAKTFAKTGRQHREYIMTSQELDYDLLLQLL